MRRGTADTSSGRDEHGGHSTAMAEIVVPDSYAGFVRLLLFLYTGGSAAPILISSAFP